MQPGQPSRTAEAAARHRAAHQVLERGSLFKDPLALRILGVDPGEFAGAAESEPFNRGLRLFIAIRSRLSEDYLAASVRRGVDQLVVLGAGLDTYAYRSKFGGSLRIFEVDHPDTQAWKRQRLSESGIGIPGWLVFAPVDFERESLSDGLAAAGFDPAQASFFAWLGVVPYLTKEAVYSTLGFIAGLPGGARVVFDYANPIASIPESKRSGPEALAARVAAAGESFKSHFETVALRTRLQAMGYRSIEDFGPKEIAKRFFPGRERPASSGGGHIVRAAIGPIMQGKPEIHP